MNSTSLQTLSLFQTSHRLSYRNHPPFLLLLVLLTSLMTYRGYGQLLTDDFSDGIYSPVTSKDVRILSVNWSGTNLHRSDDASNNPSLGNIGLNHVYYLTMAMEEGYEMSITSISVRTNGNGPNSFQIKVNDENFGAGFPMGSFESTTTTGIIGKLRKVITIQLAVSNADSQNWTAIDNFIVNGSITEYTIPPEVIPTIPDANGILYVDGTKNVNGTGSSWGDALNQLDYALKGKDSNPAIKQIWVVKGVYQPSAESLSFELRNDLKVYGGFRGDETELTQRQALSYKTILQGRGSSVIHNTNINNTALLDGFYISGGSGYAATELARFGAGMYNKNSSPLIVNCIFTDNASDPATFGGRGGGMYNLESNPTLLQCIFKNNKSQGITYGQGGGLFNVDSSPIIRNCLFIGNSAAGRTNGPNGNGAAIANDGSSSPVIENTIIWNNPDTSIPAGFSSISTMFTSPNSSVVSYSLIQGGYANGNHIIDTDPGFTDEAGGNYQQTKTSPVINAGKPSTDLSGFPENTANEAITLSGTRRVIETIDIGPFEVPNTNIWYVNAASTATNPDGKSWPTAFPTLQQALGNAFSDDQIWVSKGQYQPASGKSFSMIEGVNMYGGFKGGEASPSERPFRFGQSSKLADCTVLLGNGNRLIFVTNNWRPLVLDGFTIKGGNAAVGGGLWNQTGNLQIHNCAFISNTATDHGGGIYQSGINNTITNTVFTSNRTTNGEGGAVSGVSSVGSSFMNCIFNDNSALRGGAISLNASSNIIANSTFYGNSSTAGETVYFDHSETTVFNCIMYGNFGGIVTSDGEPAIQGSLIQNRGTSKVNNNLSGDIDPQFVDPANGDFRLLSCSPTINRGVNNEFLAMYPDLAGKLRVFNKQMDMGAFEAQQLPDAKQLTPNATSTLTLPVYAGITSFVRDCETIALIEPIGGASGVKGDIVAKSYVKSGQTLVAGTQVFVKRHYDLTPSDSPGAARITLFFTQQEFDAYNQAYGNANGAALPANLKIVQYHGFSVSGLPDTYSGSKEVITDLDVVFDSINGIYSVSFDVTGFSGFFASGQPTGALPVNLISLKASELEGKGYLQWATSSESNSDRFEVERSGSSQSWATIGQVRSQGDAASVASYFFWDQQPLVSENLYRLKMIDRDGTYAYSRIVGLYFGNESSPALYPNPAIDQVKILNIADSQIIKVEFYDNGGKMLTSQSRPVNGKLDISRVPSGIYTVKFTLENNQSRQLRLVIVK